MYNYSRVEDMAAHRREQVDREARTRHLLRAGDQEAGIANPGSRASARWGTLRQLSLRIRAGIWRGLRRATAPSPGRAIP